MGGSCTRIIDNIHLLQDSEGDWKIYSPCKEKNVFHDGNARGGIWFLCGNKSLYLLNIPAIVCLFYQKT